jgi:hypothetical protein
VVVFCVNLHGNKMVVSVSIIIIIIHDERCALSYPSHNFEEITPKHIYGLTTEHIYIYDNLDTCMNVQFFCIF